VLNPGASIATNGGNVTLAGDPNGTGFAIGTASNAVGVTINGASLMTTGGTVTLAGTGGNGYYGNYGVYLSNSSITTGGGALNVTGTGGDSGYDNYGMYAYGTTLDTSNQYGGTGGALTLVGTGGNGTDYNYGVLLDGGEGALRVSTGGGALTITGTGNGTGSYNYGIYTNYATLDASNSGGSGGTVTLSGTGGNGTDDNSGVYLSNSSITTGGGALNMTGTAGSGGSNSYGIDVSLASLDTSRADSTDADVNLASVENVNLGAITSGGDINISAANGITQYSDLKAYGNVSLTANANGGSGNFIQNSGLISNVGTLNAGNITINAYDIQVGAVDSKNSVILNAAHDIEIVYGIPVGGQNFHVDDESFSYTLPFGFTYYGVPYTTMYVSSNGIITFGGGTSEYVNSTASLIAGVDYTPRPTIAPAWSDWVTWTSAGPGKDIYIGQPSVGALAVRWDVANFSDSSYTANFQAVLSQSGNIQFNYGAATAMAPGYTATIGVSAGDGVHYTLSALDNPTSLNNLSSTQFNYNTTTGNYDETVGSAAGLVITRSGSVSALGAVSMAAAGALNINNAINAAMINARGAGITLNTAGALTASGTGDAIVLNAGTGTFTNNAGANALSNTGGGRWLIWSADPTELSLGGLAEGFRQYNATYGVTIPDSRGNGLNGLMFSDQGTIAPTIGGTTTKVYDGTTAATGITLSGSSAYGDSIVSSDPFNYLNKNVGSGKTIDPASVVLNVANNGVPVYDNTLILPTGGEIVPAPLTISAVSDTKTYDGTTSSAGTPTANLVTGTVAGGVADSLIATQVFDSRNAMGTNGSTLSVSSYTVNDGNGGNNYSTPTFVSATGTINKANLTISATTDTKTYDGTTSSAGTPTANLVTGTVTGGVADSLIATQVFNSPDVMGANGSTLSVSSYTVNDGNGGNNYSITYQTALGAITQRPLSTWIGGTTGNWSVASNWDALPDLSNVAAVSIPSGTTVTYDSGAGTTNLASLTAGGLSITGGTLNIANKLTVNSSFSQTGGTLGAFAGGSSASITQASGNLTLPAITVASLNLSAPTGAITQSGPLAALTLVTQSQGATTLDNPNNQVAGRVDMTAGGPLTLWASGDLSLGAINAGANAVEIKAGGAILQAPGTESSTNIIAGSADLSSIFGGASGDLAISTNTQVTGALTATVGSATAAAGQQADFGGIRIQNTGAEPASMTLTDNALSGASVSFLNTGDIASTSGITLKTLTGGDLALLSNGNIIWDSGSLATPSGSVLVSAGGSLGVTGALTSPVDLALSSTSSINVGGSVVTAGSGTASFTAPTVALDGTVNSADDVGIIASALNLGAGSSTGAAHDVIFAADNITATNATVSAGHDISAAVTGDLRLNGSSFTAGNDIYVNMLGATSTLYLNDTAGLPLSFLWAQAPSTIHLSYAAEAFGRMVVDGAVVDPFTFVASPDGSGLFYGAAKTPATPGAGLDLVYGIGPGASTTVAPTLVSAVIAAISSSTSSATASAGTLPPIVYGNGLGAEGGLGGQGQTIGGTEGSFGGGEEEDENKNKTDQATGLKKKSNKSITKKLSTCS
jgi:trimeric autotransporter adhesin